MPKPQLRIVAGQQADILKAAAMCDEAATLCDRWGRYGWAKVLVALSTSMTRSVQ